MDPQELRARRRALGLTQRALGQRINVPQETLSRWETGQLRIERPAMLALALDALAHEQQHAPTPVRS